MFIKDTEQWAEQTFGNADLGDKRRTKRLVKLSGQLAARTGASIVQAAGDTAAIEGAYRFIRNNKIDASDIAEAGFNALLGQLYQSKTVLALEDTSTLSYQHCVRKELGTTGTNPNSKTKGMLVHSVLLVDADGERTLGLGAQQRWCRKQEDFGQKHKRHKRGYEDKESYKWQSTSEALSMRYAPVMERIISVCDRESDIFEYLNYKQANQQRFVVRVNHDRALLECDQKLKEHLGQQSSTGSYQVHVQQKGGRKARIAKVAVRFAQVIIQAPKEHPAFVPIQLNIVTCEEIHAPAGVEPLCWRLYTSEAVDSMEDALTIIRYYELRWRVEEFHKAWKSAGTKVESFKLQKRKNLEKMMVITAFIAIRLLQLRELISDKEKSQKVSCSSFFNKAEWQLLWLKTEFKPLPKEPPSLYWAYYALAKLGRWYDSKRNGRVGWNALWDGWHNLTELIESIRLVQNSLDEM
jgi:hypothetical protein